MIKMDKVLLITIGVYVFFAAISGYIRGLKRSYVRLGNIFASAIIAFFAAKPLTVMLLSGTELAGGLSIESSSGVLGALAASETVTSILEALPTMVVSLFTYVVVFLVVDLLMFIPQAIITAKMDKEKKWGGLGIGVLCGFLVFVLSCAPFLYIIDLTTKIYAQIPEKTKESVKEEFVEGFEDVADIYTGDKGDGAQAYEMFDTAMQAGPITSALSTIVSPLVDSMTSMEINGEKTSLSQEVDKLVPIIGPTFELVEKVEEIDLSSQEGVQELLNDENVDEIIATVTSNETLVPVVDQMVSSAIAENIPEEVTNDKESMEQFAEVVNTLNQSEDKTESIKNIVSQTGYDIPDSAIEYLSDYIDRNLAGTDWTAESLAEKINEMRVPSGN